MMVTGNGEDYAEHVSEGCHDRIDDSIEGDGEMSVEKLDDAVAALAFAATILTITLGFLFNL